MPSVLESTVQGRQIGNHPIQIRHLPEKSDLRGCHLLFIGGRNAQRAAGLLVGLKNVPVLTVGESERFVQQGGMIGLCVDENKIRFEINLEAAQRANLRISSRLLLLAKSVIGAGKQG